MAIDYTQLAQTRENSTSAVSIYQSGTAQTVQLFFKFANVTSAPALLRVFHDQNGNTYDQSTALVYDLKLMPGEIFELDHVFANNPSGNIAYRSSVANALTATVYGVVRS
ncbi:MAG: hypothetical protein KJP07_23250 [Desulfatitalea sp.]|nr:hypothetical protein [Desulfatitalea sp.]